MLLPLLLSLLGSTSTSGVVGLKTNDPLVIARAVKFFLEREPDHCVELVRVAKGKGVVLAFSSCMTPDGLPTQMAAFTSPDAFAALAKVLAQPVWGGFAVAGSSSRQRAYALDAEGRVRWTSDCDFAQSEEERRAEADPFVDPIELHRGWVRRRNGAGYGRLAEELGFNYWLVINIETGEADLTSNKRRIVKGDVGAHVKWLQSPWSPPEGVDYEPAPTPLPPGASGLLVCNGCGAGAAATIAGAIGELAQHRAVAAPSLLVQNAASSKRLALQYGGRAGGGSGRRYGAAASCAWCCNCCRKEPRSSSTSARLTS